MVWPKPKKPCDQKDYGNISLSIEGKDKQLRILYPVTRSFKNKSEILHVWECFEERSIILVIDLYLHRGLKTATNYIDKYKRFSIVHINFLKRRTGR